MSYALGQVLANAGYTVSDASPSGLVTALSNTMFFVKSVTSKNANYTIALADIGTTFSCTSTITLGLTAAATLAANWYCLVRNDGTGLVTIDPNASETIDGLATITLKPRESALIICDGSNFKTIGRGYLPGVVAKSANYTAVAGDMGSVFSCTSTITLSLTAAATLTNDWFAYVRNDGTGVITIDPNGSETIDGLTTITLGPGNACLIVCDGTGFKTIGRRAEYICLRDEKTSGTNGGTFTSGAWRTRDLNTEAQDTGGNCSLASNQFTLDAGTYRIKAYAPSYQVGSHQTKLRNVTDAADVILGSTERNGTGQATTTLSHVDGRFTITAQKTFELQHQCATTGTSTGFGFPASFGTEVYSTVELWKEV